MQSSINKEYWLAHSSEFAACMDLTKGTRWLAFRDVPNLIKKYVRGTVSLDYGCGPGNSSLFLKSCGFHVEGVDIDEVKITTAKQMDPDGLYITIESGEIPQDSNHYDLIFCSFVFPYVSTKDEILKIMLEILRCLKPGGIFMAIVMNEHTYRNDYCVSTSVLEKTEELFSGCLTKFCINTPKIMAYNYFWSNEDYQELLSKVGFKLLRVHYPLGKDSDGFEWLSEKEKPYCTIYVARKTSDCEISRKS